MRSSHPLSRLDDPAHAVIVAVLLAVGIGQGVVQAGRHVTGAPNFWIDARRFWRPAAEAVMSGTPLYVGEAVDNKPPGFILLDVAVYATGHFGVVFFVLLGVANATTAYLLYRWQDRVGHPMAGALAGLLFLAALPTINGTIINVRSFALVPIMGAILTTTPWKRGALLGASGMIVQYAAFAIPALLYDGLRDARNRLRWTVLFCTSGLAVVSLTFAVVYAIWGYQSLIGALEYTFAVVGDYSTQSTFLSPTRQPDQWAEKLIHAGERLPHLLIPAAVILAVQYVSPEEMDRSILLSALLAGSFALALLVKSLLYYWILIVPFLAVLAARAIEWAFHADVRPGRAR